MAFRNVSLQEGNAQNSWKIQGKTKNGKSEASNSRPKLTNTVPTIPGPHAKKKVIVSTNNCPREHFKKITKTHKIIFALYSLHLINP